MPDKRAWLAQAETPEGWRLSVGGTWRIDDAGYLDQQLRELVAASRRVTLDLSQIDMLDTAGAWLLHRTASQLRERGAEVRLAGAHPEHAALLRSVAESFRPCECEPPPRNALLRMVERVGETSLGVLDMAAEFVGFLGRAVAVLVRTILHPGRLRAQSLVAQMEQVGLNALPIVALIAFLIGIVLAYQGAIQLERFGAQVFVVDLVAISLLRELAVVLTAIVIAGRSGSAFTAQIGSMNVHEEIDALRALGLDPMEVLVLPRMLALIITLPLLAFLADVMGLLGGGLMCWVGLDIAPEIFLERVNQSVGLNNLWAGLLKAPVFALLIALIGCYEGFQVSGSAESVGRQTTRSVVEAIFVVIVADALFSIFFNIIGL